MTTEHLEASILEAAQNNNDRLDALLDEAEESMEVGELNALLDKVAQILSESLRDVYHWKEGV